MSNPLGSNLSTTGDTEKNLASATESDKAKDATAKKPPTRSGFGVPPSTSAAESSGPPPPSSMHGGGSGFGGTAPSTGFGVTNTNKAATTEPLRLVFPYRPLATQEALAKLPLETFTEKSGTGLFGQLSYKTKEANEEFLRYCHRALDGAIVMAVSLLGGLAGLNPDSNDPHVSVTAQPGIIIFSICLPIELALHCVCRGGQRFTYTVARIRCALHLLAAFTAVYAISFAERLKYLACPDRDGYYSVHGEHANPMVKHQGCARSVSTYFVATITLLLCIPRLDFWPHVLLALVNLALYLIALYILVDDEGFKKWLFGDDERSDHALVPDSPQERHIIGVVSIIVTAISICYGFARHRSYQKQFEAAIGAFYQMGVSQQRNNVVDSLLSTMVPPTALDRLITGQRVLDQALHSSVLFSDIVQFTQWSSQRDPGQVVAMLSVLVRAFDSLASDLGVEKVKTIGDAYWAVAGIPEPSDTHAETMVRFGLGMLDLLVAERKKYGSKWAYPALPASSGGGSGLPRELEMRIGINSGSIIGGVLGTQQLSYEIFGETSSHANWIEQEGIPMEVVVSGLTKELVEEDSDQFDFSPHQAVLWSPRKQEMSPLRPAQAENAENEGTEDSFVAKAATDDDTQVEKSQPPVTGADEDGLDEINLGMAPRAAAGADNRNSGIIEPRTVELFIVKKRRTGEAQLSLLGSDVGSVRSHASKCSSHGSIQGSQGVAAEAKDGRAQRIRFVQAQIAKRNAAVNKSNFDASEETSASASTAENVDSVKQRYSKRKYCWGLLTLADAEAEDEFSDFANRDLKQWREAGIMAMLVVVGLLFILFVADAKQPPPAGSLLFWWLAIGSWCLGLGFSFRDYPKACGIVSICGMLLLILAFVMAHPANATVSNHPMYLLPLSFPLLVMPNVQIPSLGLFGLVFVCEIIPASYAAIFIGPNVDSNLTFIILVSSGIILLLVMHEKRVRVQVYDTKVAEHFAAQQMIAVRAQEALLATMVPDFVVKPLSHWILADFDPAKAVAKHYDDVSVGFLRLTSPPIAVESQLKGDGDTSGLDFESIEWLFAGHRAIDELLDDSKVVDKVKTVGDLVIIAGSFRGDSSIRAVAHMLSLVVRLHKIFTRKSKNDGGGNAVIAGGGGDDNGGGGAPSLCSSPRSSSNSSSGMTIGLHVGTVMGIVLGFNRLAFDIFGDTVNTTSRVMTSPISKGKICASSDFLERLPAAPYTLRHPRTTGEDAVPEMDTCEGDTIEYSPECQVRAKGKGLLRVREIQHN